MNALAWAFQNGYTPGTPARIGVFACSRAATFSRAQSVSPCAAATATANIQNSIRFIVSPLFASVFHVQACGHA